MFDDPPSNAVPFNLDNLIHRRQIEGNRVEFKATWDDQIEPAVVRTICAFANDLLNLNGGYLVLGVEEDGGRPKLPPRGLDDLDLEAVQQAVRVACLRIDPPYQPLLFPADYQGRSILVIWAPAGDTRFYQAPEKRPAKGEKSNRLPWIRRGPETIQARDNDFRQLLEVTAKTPFDDRRHLTARIEDISPTLVRRFLHQIGSDILRADPPLGDYELYRKLRLLQRVNGYEVPRNVALLFFHENPEQFFEGARIEVARFADDAGGDLIEERIFRGPLPLQVHEALEYLRNIHGELVRKVAGQAEAVRTFAYPYEAMEEAMVNALYHRGYDHEPEPTKVYVYPDRMEFRSFPGPVPGFQMGQLLPGYPGPIAPARNRRIGEFFKELNLAESRGTGIPKLQRTLKLNGSGPATFDFDEPTRTYYRTTIPMADEWIIRDQLRSLMDGLLADEYFHIEDYARNAMNRDERYRLIASQVLNSLAETLKGVLAGRVEDSDLWKEHLVRNLHYGDETAAKTIDGCYTRDATTLNAIEKWINQLKK